MQESCFMRWTNAFLVLMLLTIPTAQQQSANSNVVLIVCPHCSNEESADHMQIQERRYNRAAALSGKTVHYANATPREWERHLGEPSFSPTNIRSLLMAHNAGSVIFDSTYGHTLTESLFTQALPATTGTKIAFGRSTMPGSSAPSLQGLRTMNVLVNYHEEGFVAGAAAALSFYRSGSVETGAVCAIFPKRSDAVLSQFNGATYGVKSVCSKCKVEALFIPTVPSAKGETALKQLLFSSRTERESLRCSALLFQTEFAAGYHAAAAFLANPNSWNSDNVGGTLPVVLLGENPIDDGIVSGSTATNPNIAAVISFRAEQYVALYERFTSAQQEEDVVVDLASLNKDHHTGYGIVVFMVTAATGGSKTFSSTWGDVQELLMDGLLRKLKSKTIRAEHVPIFAANGQLASNEASKSSDGVRFNFSMLNGDVEVAEIGMRVGKSVEFITDIGKEMMALNGAKLEADELFIFYPRFGYSHPLRGADTILPDGATSRLAAQGHSAYSSFGPVFFGGSQPNGDTYNDTVVFEMDCDVEVKAACVFNPTVKVHEPSKFMPLVVGSQYVPHSSKNRLLYVPGDGGDDFAAKRDGMFVCGGIDANAMPHNSIWYLNWTDNSWVEYPPFNYPRLSVAINTVSPKTPTEFERPAGDTSSDQTTMTFPAGTKYLISFGASSLTDSIGDLPSGEVPVYWLSYEYFVPGVASSAVWLSRPSPKRWAAQGSMTSMITFPEQEALVVVQAQSVWMVDYSNSYITEAEELSVSNFVNAGDGVVRNVGAATQLAQAGGHDGNAKYHYVLSNLAQDKTSVYLESLTWPTKGPDCNAAQKNEVPNGLFTGCTACENGKTMAHGLECLDCKRDASFLLNLTSNNYTDFCVMDADAGLSVATIVAASVVPVFFVTIFAFLGAFLLLSSKTRDNRNAPLGEYQCLCFTDIESSTKKWQTAPEEMAEALQLHNRIIRQAIAEHRGYEVKTVGDAFMFAVSDVSAAVAISAKIQRGLHNVNWKPQLGPHGLRVRIGVHYGSAEVRKDDITKGYDYFGTDVNIAARMESNGKPGRITVTLRTLQELRGGLEDELLNKYDLQCKVRGCISVKGISHALEVVDVCVAGTMEAGEQLMEEGHNEDTPSPKSAPGVTAVSKVEKCDAVVSLQNPSPSPTQSTGTPTDKSPAVLSIIPDGGMGARSDDCLANHQESSFGALNPLAARCRSHPANRNHELHGSGMFVNNNNNNSNDIFNGGSGLQAAATSDEGFDRVDIYSHMSNRLLKLMMLRLPKAKKIEIVKLLSNKQHTTTDAFADGFAAMHCDDIEEVVLDAVNCPRLPSDEEVVNNRHHDEGYQLAPMPSTGVVQLE